MGLTEVLWQQQQQPCCTHCHQQQQQQQHIVASEEAWGGTSAAHTHSHIQFSLQSGSRHHSQLWGLGGGVEPGGTGGTATTAW